MDLVWSLTVDGKLRTLRATHRRMAWVPQEVRVLRREEPLAHLWQDDAWPAGTAEVAADLELLGVPVDATYKVSNATLRMHDETGKGRRKSLVLAAIRYRRMRAPTVPWWARFRNQREPSHECNGNRGGFP